MFDMLIWYLYLVVSIFILIVSINLVFIEIRTGGWMLRGWAWTREAYLQTWRASSLQSIADRNMTSRFTKDFVKLRHKTCVFTSTNIAALQSALDMSDLVCLAFLMCGTDQIVDVYEFLSSANDVDSLDLYTVLRMFPEWERKLPEALGAIKNKLALMKLGISQKDMMYNRRMKDSELALCPTRVALYRIVDELRVQGGENVISKMVEFGAPHPPVRLPHLEKIAHSELLYFMFWHSEGFLNLERRENFEIFVESLISIDKGDLADYFMSPQVLHDSYVFDDHPLGVYHIKNPESPGLCIIVNQVRYGGVETNRYSSIVNVNDLVRLMGTLNFSVVTIEDLAEPEFCDTIKTTIVNSFSTEHSICIVIIMGHGEREGVLCPTGKLESHEKGDNLYNFDLGAVRIEDIQHSLFECKELEKVPKVLVLNSCRGDQQFTTRDYFRMAADAPGRGEIFSHMDIITCYSSLPKFVSWRDPQKGSIFINVFCDILTKRPDIEICELFTLMNARLMLPTADMSKAFTPLHNGYENRVGMPFDFTSSLRKKLYFRLPENFNT